LCFVVAGLQFAGYSQRKMKVDTLKGLRMLFRLLPRTHLRSKLLSMAGMAALLSGCANMSGLDPRSDYANFGNDSIIVMGVSSQTQIQVFEGERENGKWRRKLLNAELAVYPQDGYIVARLPARTGKENYGIGAVLAEGPGGGLVTPCRGAHTPTFDAPGGKVVYVGDFRMNSGRRYQTSSSLMAARAHLKRRYPLIADKLVDGGGFESLEINNVACTIVVPVHLGK
jgi:hypothetical protein